MDRNGRTQGTQDSQDQLIGRWVHSYEDDHDGLSVFRRPEFPFPPARGRRGIEFTADGGFIEWAIGRGDASQARPGRWERTPGGMGAGGGAGATIARTDAGAALRVVRAEPDLLEVVAEDAS